MRALRGLLCNIHDRAGSLGWCCPLANHQDHRVVSIAVMLLSKLMMWVIGWVTNQSTADRRFFKALLSYPTT